MKMTVEMITHDWGKATEMQTPLVLCEWRGQAQHAYHDGFSEVDDPGDAGSKFGQVVGYTLSPKGGYYMLKKYPKK